MRMVEGEKRRQLYEKSSMTFWVNFQRLGHIVCD